MQNNHHYTTFRQPWTRCIKPGGTGQRLYNSWYKPLWAWAHRNLPILWGLTQFFQEISTLTILAHSNDSILEILLRAPPKSFRTCCLIDITPLLVHLVCPQWPQDSQAQNLKPTLCGRRIYIWALIPLLMPECLLRETLPTSSINKTQYVGKILSHPPAHFLRGRSACFFVSDTRALASVLIISWEWK